MTVTAAVVAALNIGLGLVYTQYGTMTAIEMKRGWRTLGFSHFGAAWIAMAFTCGPHHWIHGLHVAVEGRPGGILDVLAVAVGVPAGVTWFALRVEAFRGGAGDRFLPGNPFWVLALPTLAGVYVTALAAAMIAAGGVHAENLWIVVPNLMLVGIYMTIGYFLLRTQLRNRGPLGGWSVSGLALSVIFPTCALMHGVMAYYSLMGRYAFDVHGFSIDWLAVPAGLYFLWVVRGLYLDAIKDWNSLADAAADGGLAVGDEPVPASSPA
jgi:hypothetical protein